MSNVITERKVEDKKGEEKRGYKFMGIGAAGDKGILAVLEVGEIEQDELILINSTKKDIPEDYNGVYIGLTGKDSGCGKERAVAKEYAVRTMKSGIIKKYITDDIDSVVLVCSIGGGTGSGATPIIAEYCKKVLGKHVHIIVFTGFEEDARELQNSVDFFEELNFDCDVQVIRNSAFLEKNNNNKFRAEEAANKELITRIRAMLGKGMIPSKQNIDTTDMYKIINTVGYKTVEHKEITEDLVDVDAFNRVIKQMIYNSKSLKSSVGQIRMGVFLNLSPASEDAVDYNYTILKETYGVPYETFTHAQYDGGKQYITFIISGMKLPIDEVKSINDKYIEVTASVDNEKDDFFDKLSGLDRGSSDQFDMVRGAGKSSSTTTDEDFFKSLETKPE